MTIPLNGSAAWIAVTAVTAFVARRVWHWYVLVRAKHFSLAGHPRLASRLARQVRLYEFDGDRFFDSDGAPSLIVETRRRGFDRLAATLSANATVSRTVSTDLESAVSDLRFVNRYRVPFQYRRYVADRLRLGSVLEESSDVRVRDLDGRWSYDLSGSYGVNLFGYDFYKACIDAGAARVRGLGPALGPYHPIVADNVQRLQRISGMDEVSFHMSGTEAVMQAVRLARFHTGRSHVVRCCGAYHGWWDDVQPGPGSPSTTACTYTLKEMDRHTLRVLRSRDDIACVLINPIQSIHPNQPAPSDATLVGERQASFDRAAYTDWLRALRQVCTDRGIVLVFDEVFVGFRLAYGGGQEYFGVSADLVVYGKTVAGGLPIGVVCGAARYMKRYRDDYPSDVCFARGTFNSHPYVMATMNEFLTRLESPELRRSYDGLDQRWSARAAALNQRLAREAFPIVVENLVSIWTVMYTVPSRYNWMFQYYLRAHGLALSWIGTGRFIFSHNFTDDDLTAVFDRILAAARAMRDDGWWWCPEGQTNRRLARTVAREMIGAIVSPRLRRRRYATSSAGTIGSNSSPRSTYSGDLA